jgi:hypothetical protein
MAAKIICEACGTPQRDQQITAIRALAAEWWGDPRHSWYAEEIYDALGESPGPTYCQAASGGADERTIYYCLLEAGHDGNHEGANGREWPA